MKSWVCQIHIDCSPYVLYKHSSNKVFFFSLFCQPSLEKYTTGATNMPFIMHHDRPMSNFGGKLLNQNTNGWVIKHNAERIDPVIKGQLISKQNCRAITSPKKQTLDFYFQVYYFKVSTKESLSSCKKKIDSLFVLTLK